MDPDIECRGGFGEFGKEGRKVAGKGQPLRRGALLRARAYTKGKPDDNRVAKGVTENMRVKVVKNSDTLAIGGLKSPVSTRIFGLAPRIYPLKAMQVVDFPHIEENKGEGSGIIQTEMDAKSGDLDDLSKWNKCGRLRED